MGSGAGWECSPLPTVTVETSASQRGNVVCPERTQHAMLLPCHTLVTCREMQDMASCRWNVQAERSEPTSL